MIFLIAVATPALSGSTASPTFYDETGLCGNGVVEGFEECDCGPDVPFGSSNFCPMPNMADR